MSLSRLSAINPPVREALSLDLSKGFDSALMIVDALRRAVRVAEVKFLQVALQVRFANVVVRAVDAALEQAEIRFDRVAVNAARACIFARAVVRGFVRGKLVAKAHEFV